MYLRVMYYKPEAQAYAGREYTYTTELSLQVGDKVIAPTAKEPMQKAIVTEIDVPETEIDPSWASQLKEIRGYAE